MSIPPLYTEAQAAQLLSLSKSTLQQYRRLGRGPMYIKFGGAVRYHEDDLNAYLDSRRRTPQHSSTRRKAPTVR